MTRRPKPIKAEPLTAACTRGPDAEGRWYWRVRWWADTPEGRKRKTKTLGSGWYKAAAPISFLTGPWQLGYQLLFAKGCRPHEVQLLTRAGVEVVSDDEAWVTVPATAKTGSREVPISGDAVAALAVWLESNGGEPTDRLLGVRDLASGLHFRLNGQGRKDGKRTPGILDELGIEHFGCYGLRRLAVDRLYRRVGDPATAAAMLGHSPETAMKYYRSVGRDAKREAARAAGLGEGTPMVVKFPGR